MILILFCKFFSPKEGPEDVHVSWYRYLLILDIIFFYFLYEDSLRAFLVKRNTGLIMPLSIPIFSTNPAHPEVSAKRKVESRLRAELEDLTMAVDLQSVYSKVKFRIASFSVMNHVKA